MDLGIWQSALIALIVFLSAVVQSSIGIGFAMLATATLSFFIDPVSCAALISWAAVVFGSVLSYRLREYIDLRITLPPMLAMVIARVCGIEVLMRMDAGFAKAALGVILILFSAYFYFFGERVKIKPKPWKGFVLGLLAGFLGGIYSLTGPFAAVYFYSALDDKLKYAASMNLAFLPSAVVGLIMHWHYGNISAALLPTYGIASVAVVAGVGVGMRVLRRINRKQLSAALYLFMAALGLATLIISRFTS